MASSNYNYSRSILLDKAGEWIEVFHSRRFKMMSAAVAPVVIPPGSIPTIGNRGRTAASHSQFLSVPKGAVQFSQVSQAGRQQTIGPKEIGLQQSSALLANLQAAQNRFYGKE